MNTGIGDAVNLAWKLAHVLRGRAPDGLLDSYEPERMAFARNLVETHGPRVLVRLIAEGGFADFVRTRHRAAVRVGRRTASAGSRLPVPGVVADGHPLSRQPPFRAARRPCARRRAAAVDRPRRPGQPRAAVRHGAGRCTCMALCVPDLEAWCAAARRGAVPFDWCDAVRRPAWRATPPTSCGPTRTSRWPTATRTPMRSRPISPGTACAQLGGARIKAVALRAQQPRRRHHVAQRRLPSPASRASSGRSRD